jgi:predicted nucleic acid-binding protein
MILADTTVAIDYERARTPRLQQIIQANNAAVCGLTVAEMFAGVRTAKDEARCLAALADFQRLAIADTLWETVGRNQSQLLAHGLTLQLPDVAIATLALDLDLELWHYDRHFFDIQRVFPQLKFFQEPP